MENYVEVAKIGELSEARGRTVEVKGRLIALFLLDQEPRAIDDICPHMGGSLGEGHVENGIVMCPWHAWRFRIADGVWADAPSSGTRVETYTIRVDGERVLLRVDW
jgi:nitrite reductase/ring-hydroxylating ferredoxin subunit